MFIKTKAVFRLDGKDVITEPNTLILFDIYTPHYYHAFESGLGDAAPVVDTLFNYTRMGSDASWGKRKEEVAEIAGNSVYRSTYSARLIELRKDIYAHPEFEWTTGGMAERLHVSKPYFQEIYKAAFSVTCGADVISARIEAAKLLMTDTDLPISEIGERCGYESIIHFSRQFKKMTGVSPSAYRKMYR